MERLTTAPVRGDALAARVRHAVARLSALSCGCIDASTIIYAEKSGFFCHLESAVSLISTSEVLREARYVGSSIFVVRAGSRLSADDGLVAAARRIGLPVLSDDRRIVRSAKTAGLDCFNAVMLLHLLYLRGVVDFGEHRGYMARLLQLAWYGSRIRAFADACYRDVHAAVCGAAAQESEAL